MKQFSLFLSIFLLSIVSHAQTCSSYGFTATTGTFNTISGTGTSTTAISADDVTLPNVPIGFTFRFCGNNYTNVSVCSNGWLSLANTTTDYGYVNDPTNVASYAFPVTSTGFLMPFWDDLWGTGQTAYYQTSGTAPYRTFTFEWSNWSLYADYVHYANFQVILYETTNQIDYVYGTSSFPTRTATIGIANSPTDYKVLNNSTSSPTASTSTFTTSIATLPANAQIYRWNPAATACSGTPTAGTASSAQTSVCASGTINLSLTGYTLLSGVTYQWQKSTDGTTWTNISGATNVTASTTESVSTYYRCNVTCTASSTTSSSANVLVPYTTSCYCTPAYSRAFASCDSLDVSIDGFKVNGTAGTSINDISHCNGTGYINQTSTNVALLAATTYTATIMGSATYTMNAQVWIDFNNDMTFQSSESVGGLNAYGATGTFSLTIPSGAATGTHRMRVVTADNASGHSYSTMDPCTSGYALGEARDYNVTIYATCSGTPLGGTASTSASPVCSAVSFTLSNSGYTVGGSITYQWQSSPDNTTWTSMTGATTLTYTGTETATTYYRCLVTCTASSTATPSASILVSYLSSCYCTPAYSAASAACTAGTAIANLQIAGLSGTVLNDAIACTGAGFQNRTSLSVTIGQGTTATAYIGGGTTSQNTQAWIDYDNNGTFASAESVGGLNGFTTSGSFTITIPAGAATGVHRMRVVTSAASDGFSYSSMNPCTPSYVNGEARDYSINIVPYCSGTPTAGTVSPSATSSCSTFSPTITASGYSTGNNFYRWESSSDSATWTRVAGATLNVYAPSVTTTTYFRFIDSCGTNTLLGRSAGVKITINTVPTVVVTPVSATYCNGSSTSITASGASTYSWSPATALSASTGATVTCTATITTTYTITGTSAAGCTGTATQTITVNPIPVLTVTPVSASYCTGGSTNITASGASTYSWSPATNLSATTGATVTCNTAATRTYTITGTSAAGCAGTATQTITVNAIPVLTVTPVSATYCNGSSTSITASGASTYSWSPATALSASTGATVTCSATTTTTYTVTGTSAAGCTGTATQTITVNPIPVLTVTPVSASYCAGGSTNITASGASTYSWSPATNLSATTGATVSCNTAATRTYTITGTSAAGCVGTATQTITVNPIPVLTVTPVSATYCNGSSTSITASGASTYSWSPATALSASTGATVTCTATTTTTYTVTGTSGAGCTGTATQTITVNPIPVLTVTPVSASYCNGSSSSITASGASTYTWSPATNLSATTGATVTCNTAATRTYTITGASAAGCAGTATQTITVNAIPVLTVTPVSASYCTGGSTNITASGASTYSWSPATNLSATTGATVTCNTAATRTYTITGTSAAGCAGTATQTITVNSIPVLTVTPVASTICSGTTTNISASGAATFTWAPSTALSASTGTTVTCSATGTTTYTITGTSGAGCTVTATQTIAVNAAPILTVIPVASSYCAGGSTSITASGAISYSWSPATNLSGTTGSTVTSNTAATRTYTVTGTNGAGCTGTQTTTISVNALPSAATITSAITPCTGHATNIVFSGTAGDTIRYAIDGGVYIPVVLAGGTYTLSTGIITSSHTYLLHNVRNAACFLNIDTTILVHPILLSWIGVADTSWNNTGNWSCGTIPTATDDVYLNPGGTFLPAMPAASNISVRNMSIASGASIRANATATINIKGNLTLHGNINGQGYVKLNGTIAQTISGTGKLENFELNNSAGATITTGSKLTITNTLAVQAGTLATGDSLVLYSDSIATARVLPMPPTGAAISGNVKAMQYIPGGLRRFRFVSHPFSSYIGLNQIQNGIDITGIGGSSNGFTNTASNAPSAFRYNPLVGNDSLGYDPGWRPFTSAYTTADSNRLHQYQGVRLFFRGQKGEGLSYGTYTPSSATIAQTGVLNQGTQYVTLAKGSVSHQDYNMVGNPYASPVDIGTVIHNAKVAGKLAGSAYYVWNPYLGAAGQFQAITINTTTATPYYLQANCAFQVRAAHNGDTLTFTETNKGPAANVALLKANNDFVMLTIYDANYHPWDMLQLQFNADASAKDGDEDATKPSGADFNFYSKSADNHKLAIDSRPYEAGNVIPLGISGNYAQDYIIKTENLAIPTGSNLYLHDKLLQQYVALQTGSEYKFSVTADKATQGEQRFELSMDPQLTTAGNTRKGLQINLTPNPATDNVNIDFSTDNNNIQVRIVDLGGVNVYQTEITGKQSGKVNISKGKFTAGIYMVEITSGDQKVIQRLIKE